MKPERQLGYALSKFVDRPRRSDFDTKTRHRIGVDRFAAALDKLIVPPFDLETERLV